MLADTTDKVADLAVARQRQKQAEAAAKKADQDANHHELAVAWCEDRTVQGHAPQYTNGAFHVPDADSQLWCRITEEQVAVQVAKQFGGRKLCRKHADFTQITRHISALIECGDYFDRADPGVASPAGMHSLCATGAVKTEPLDLAHRQTWALPFAPEYETDAPLLEGVLDQAFDGDHAKDQKDLFWQAVGATLFGLMPRLQTVVLLLGRERSGKSLLQRLLERIVPPEAVSAVSPASWGHEYHVAALAGKRINIVGELSDEAPIPAAAFKNVTGQNLVAGRHPTHRPFSFRCLAAHWFASNVLPPTTDRSEAFYRRWRVLRFSNTVPAERVDPNLFDKIIANEMPAILANAFLGAERVQRAGALRTTAAHDQVLERWRLAANPLQQFLTDVDWIELDPAAELHTRPEVYEAYRRWCSACGFRNPFGRNHFLDLLDATGASRGVRLKRAGTKDVVAGLRLLRRVDL